MDLYSQKVTTLNNIANHIDNKRMPIIDMAQTWAVSYANAGLQECIDDGKTEIEVYGKHLEDMYFDGIYIFGLNAPVNVYKGLGFEPLFVSPDGVTLQYAEQGQMLLDDEVERFAKDPKAFLKEVLISRRYPALTQDDATVRELLKNSAKALFKTKMNTGKKLKALKDKYQTPACQSTDYVVSPPFDQFMLYRGLRSTMADMRRRPNLVKEACESMIDFYAPTEDSCKPFPWVSTPIVSACFLSPKQFDEFLWPTFSYLLSAYISRGAKFGIYLEGTWGDCCERLADMPKNTIIGYLESDDFFSVQKKIGDKVAIGYPFPHALLKMGTTSQVEDEAKRVIDLAGTCATFMSLDKALLSPGDAKAENYKALGNICRDYVK